MKTVTQNILYRQALISYAGKYGVTKAAIRYKTNRQYIYRWLKRYDGTSQSLADKSRRPHHQPNEHTADELKFITDMRKRNANAGLVVFWVKLRQRGYTRSITGLYRLLQAVIFIHAVYLRIFSVKFQFVDDSDFTALVQYFNRSAVKDISTGLTELAKKALAVVEVREAMVWLTLDF